MATALERDLQRLTEGVILCRQLYLLIHGKPEMKNPKLAALVHGTDRLNHKFDKRMDDALAELPQVEAEGDAAFDEMHAHNQAKLADFAEVRQFVADLQEVAKSNGGPTERATETDSQQSGVSVEQPLAVTSPGTTLGQQGIVAGAEMQPVPFAKTA